MHAAERRRKKNSCIFIKNGKTVYADGKKIDSCVCYLIEHLEYYSCLLAGFARQYCSVM
jgi:hypothetical protein